MAVVGVQAITYLTISMCNREKEGIFYIKFNEFPFVTDKPMRFPAISIITHGMNSVMMLIDFLVIAFPLRILHMVYGMSLAIFFFFIHADLPFMRGNRWVSIWNFTRIPCNLELITFTILLQIWQSLRVSHSGLEQSQPLYGDLCGHLPAHYVLLGAALWTLQVEENVQ